MLHPNLVISDPDGLKRAGSSKDEAIDVDDLIKKFSSEDESTNNSFAEDVLSNLAQEDSKAECPICMDVMDSPMVIPQCMHQCCKDCIVAFLERCLEKGEDGRCPTCSTSPVKVCFIPDIFYTGPLIIS